MPLHLPRLFGRSRSHSTGIRTDLCTPYAHTKSERQAQGYVSRSDFGYAVDLLTSILKTTAEERPRNESWADWSVDLEIRNIRSFHFEDLDQKDQMMCPTHYYNISTYVGWLESCVDEVTFGSMKATIEQLRSFKEQAEQLYGKESCKAIAASSPSEGHAESPG